MDSDQVASKKPVEQDPHCSLLYLCVYMFNPMYSGNPYTSNFAKSEDPDEMQHNAAFHQGLHSL